ncbi:PEPxxWA-CTERM sorting domain-containing protein [Sphingopyxis sp.]|uniref:PEPxxWA-CTERM sorting domain-containing protein n=1 Tax=Sphingopyxis sp. TaxID=1908224 RepID=UPI0025D0C43C|nr:PEPxxWA-CTERM sorting domain-containing protein [Sphingopyxis sp.]
MLLLALMSVTIPALSGDGGSVLAQSIDALDRFTERSPGERGETDILKGKARKIADRLLGRRGNGGEPEQRALGKIFDTPPEESINELSQTPGPIALTDPIPTGLLPLGDTGGTPAGSDGGLPGFPGGISTVVPPGTSVTPIDPTTPGVPPVAAVPEPGTWASMLLGLGLCAAALRRRRRPGTKGKPGAPQCAPA